MEKRKFSDKVADIVRRVLSCCDSSDDDRPALKISAPTNFRREDVSIPGLNEMQQMSIREMAKDDAKEMWENLQPLRSSPSENFAERPALPPYQEKEDEPNTPARNNASPKSLSLSANKRMSTGSRLDRVKAHSRKISNHLAKPLGLNIMDRDDSRHEMRALMGDGDLMTPRKLSSESFSVAGSEEERQGMKF